MTFLRAATAKLECSRMSDHEKRSVILYEVTKQVSAVMHICMHNMFDHQTMRLLEDQSGVEYISPGMKQVPGLQARLKALWSALQG